jgi:hypothetical protein
MPAFLILFDLNTLIVFDEYIGYHKGETKHIDINSSGVYFFSVEIYVHKGNVNTNLRHTVIHTPLIQFPFLFFVTLCKLKLMKVWTLLVETRYSKYYNWNTRQTSRSFSWIGWITQQLQVTYLWNLKIILQQADLIWCSFLSLSFVRWCYNIYIISWNRVNGWVSSWITGWITSVLARIFESFQINRRTRASC